MQKLLGGSKGTLLLMGRGTIELTGCTATFGGGKWKIVDGTGAYAKFRADGNPVTTPESFGDVCTGAVEVTHVGRARKGERDDD